MPTLLMSVMLPPIPRMRCIAGPSPGPYDPLRRHRTCSARSTRPSGTGCACASSPGLLAYVAQHLVPLADALLVAAPSECDDDLPREGPADDERLACELVMTERHGAPRGPPPLRTVEPHATAPQ